MNKRNDMIAALEHCIPSAVPIWEVEFQAWDAALGKHVILGEEFEALTPAEQERAMHANAEIFIQVSAEFEYAALKVPGGYWHTSPGQLAYYCLPGDTRFRQAEIIRKLASAELMLTASAGAIIGANYSMDFCVRMAEDPESIDEQARQSLLWGIEQAKRWRDCGVEAVITAGDMADNSGPFFNPEQMARWVYPYLTKWSDAIRQMGMYTIMHSDGNLTRYVDAIASTGVDALQAIDPTAGMDMRKTKDIVDNRLCLCGNIDCGRLLLGQPEEIYQATQNLLTTCKAGGGLVLGASNAVQQEVPIENYRAMIAAWKAFGQYKEGSAMRLG